MTKLSLLLSLGLLALAQTANAERLTASDDAYLTGVLNNIELLQERNEYPLRVRVYRLRELGECDGSLALCPSEILLVAVSTYDEIPDQTLYRLPQSDGWQFNNWLSWPIADDDFVEFKVVSSNPDVEAEAGRMSKEGYLVRVNARLGSLVRSDRDVP